MLRHAALHFESLRPYRWRLERMAEHTKPVYTAEHQSVLLALGALDRAAQRFLSPEDYQRFVSPWFPPDQA